MRGDRGLVLNLPSRDKTLVMAVKDYAVVDINVFCSFPILLDFFTLLHVFCPELPE